MLADITLTPDLGWIVAGIVPLILALLKFSHSIGGIEQKVDDLSSKQDAASKAQEKVNEQIVARLEMLAATQERTVSKLTDHTVSDAQNFGELRGMLGAAVGTVRKSA